MERNIIVTGAAGNLGQAVVEQFKREGYYVIAITQPGEEQEIEEADDIYELDVTDEEAVKGFAQEYKLQYGRVDAIALLVGGFAMGAIEDVNVKEVDQMMKLNFYSAFNLVKHFLPGLKEANHGQFLFIGARPAVENEAGKDVVAYALSKKLVMTLADYVAEECKDTNVRSHIFVPSIIDTPQNREAMPDADFSTWVSPGEIAEAMHYAVNNSALRNMTFKLYGRA